MNNGKIKLSQIEMSIDKILRSLRDENRRKDIMKKWRKIKHSYHKYQLSNRSLMINLFFNMSLTNQIGMFVNHVVALRNDPEYENHLLNACVKIESYLDIVNQFVVLFGENKIDYNVFNMGHTTLAMLISKEIKNYNESQSKNMENEEGKETEIEKELTEEEKVKLIKEHIDKVDEIFSSWIDTLKKGIPEFVSAYAHLYERPKTEDDELFEDGENNNSIISELGLVNNDMSITTDATINV